VDFEDQVSDDLVRYIDGMNLFARSHIASIGALVTILPLAFDAFTQQVLSSQYSTTLVQSVDNTTLQIARSENYTISSNANSEVSKY
jgi:hypothetical protein